ncbi:hypothetical protein OROGR_020943 [Orobanche gracilis]
MKRSAILFLRSSSKFKRSATQKLKKLTSQEIDALPLLSLSLVLILCRVQKKKNNRSSSALYVMSRFPPLSPPRKPQGPQLFFLHSLCQVGTMSCQVRPAIALPPPWSRFPPLSPPTNTARIVIALPPLSLSGYGEEADQVELLSDWSCPKCRGKCTCSCCRKKQGLVPTGQLVKTANASGYKSVDELLHNANNVSVSPMEESTLVPMAGLDFNCRYNCTRGNEERRNLAGKMCHEDTNENRSLPRN